MTVFVSSIVVVCPIIKQCSEVVWYLNTNIKGHCTFVVLALFFSIIIKLDNPQHMTISVLSLCLYKQLHISSVYDKWWIVFFRKYLQIISRFWAECLEKFKMSPMPNKFSYVQITSLVMSSWEVDMNHLLSLVQIPNMSLQ